MMTTAVQNLHSHFMPILWFSAQNTIVKLKTFDRNHIVKNMTLSLWVIRTVNCVLFFFSTVHKITTFAYDVEVELRFFSLFYSSNWLCITVFLKYISQTKERETFGCETHKWRRHQAAVTTFFKSINNRIYLPIPVPARSTDPRTPSKHSSKFRHIATNSNAYKFFFSRTIPLWNSPPTKAVTSCY